MKEVEVIKLHKNLSIDSELNQEKKQRKLLYNTE